MRVAEEIFRQLGGKRFALMTGARKFVAGKDGLVFRLPNRFARGGINLVSIRLMPSDLYRVDFMRVRGGKVESVAVVNDVYADTLLEIFRAHTGLEPVMPKIVIGG
jgi:hypothetical protein